MDSKKLVTIAFIGAFSFTAKTALADAKAAGHGRKPASAVACPSMDLDKTVAMVKAAKTCYDADNIASQCAWGSSADAQIAGAATDNCINSVQKKMSAPDRKTYDLLGSLCDKKYAKMQGTLYISMNAFCREQVAKLFNELFTDPDAE